MAKDPIVQEYVIDTPGTHTLYLPTGEYVGIEFHLCGAGGGGGKRTSIGAAGGGGGGSVIESANYTATELSYLSGMEVTVEIPAGGTSGVHPSNAVVTFGSGIIWPHYLIAASGKSALSNSTTGALGGKHGDCYGGGFTSLGVAEGGNGANSGSTYGGGGGEAGGINNWPGENGSTYNGGNGGGDGGAGGNGATAHGQGNAGGFYGGGGGGARMVTTGAREIAGGTGGAGKFILRVYYNPTAPTDENEVLAIIEF